MESEIEGMQDALKKKIKRRRIEIIKKYGHEVINELNGFLEFTLDVDENKPHWQLGIKRDD